MEVKHLPIAVFNKDTGKASWELTQRFKGSSYFTKVYSLSNSQEIKKMINSQKVAMVVQINDDFSAKLASNQPVDIQLILDGRKTNVSQILVGYVSNIIDRYNRDEKIGVQFLPSEIVSINWFNKNLDYIWFTVPSIAGILILLMGLIITALSVAREREFGTFDQLLVSPIEPIEILIGKAIPAFVIGVLSGSFFISMGIIFFKLPFEGSLLALYFSMSIFLLAVIGVGLFISALSKTQQQAILGTFIFMVPLTTLSGYATPIENMPQWLQDLTVINILKHFLIIIKGILLKDIPFSAVLAHTLPIAIIAAITLSVSVNMFKKRLE